MKSNIPLELIEKHIRDSGWNPEKSDIIQEHEFDVKKAMNNYFIHKNNITNNNVALDLGSGLKSVIGSDENKRYILTLPELLQLRIRSNFDHEFWKTKYDVHTEESLGVDTKGLFGNKDEQVIAVIHGGGLLTPDKIIEIGKTRSQYQYNQSEFENLLNGILPNKKKIKMYHIDEFIKGISNPPHQYGIVLDNYSEIKKMPLNKLENKLTIARSGGEKILNNYYNKCLEYGIHITPTNIVYNNQKVASPNFISISEHSVIYCPKNFNKERKFIVVNNN